MGAPNKTAAKGWALAIWRSPHRYRDWLIQKVGRGYFYQHSKHQIGDDLYGIGRSLKDCQRQIDARHA